MADHREVTDKGVHEKTSSLFSYLPRKFRDMIMSSGAANLPTQPALLFNLKVCPRRDDPLCQWKFYYCAIQDKRMTLFQDKRMQVEERIVTFSEATERHGRHLLYEKCRMEAIGGKAVFWTGRYPGSSFTCIMNVDTNNFDLAFRDLDTSTIRSELQSESSTELTNRRPRVSEIKIESSSEGQDDESESEDEIPRISSEIEDDESESEDEIPRISSESEYEIPRIPTESEDEIPSERYEESDDNNDESDDESESDDEAMTEAMTAIVGNRLIFLVNHPFPGRSTHTARTFSLDVNTETWYVLPDCPCHIYRLCKPVSWKGNLYLYDLGAIFRRKVVDVVFFHFDFEKNLWLNRFSSPANTDFLHLAKRLMELPRICLLSSETSFLISSRSGTLYAIFVEGELCGDYSSIPVYAMDDLGSGWTNVSLGKIAPTCQRNRFPLPTRTCQICGFHYKGFQLIQFWEIAERDILLLTVQFHPNCMDRLRYSWWVFNKDEGVKSYGCGVLPLPIQVRNPKSDIHLLVAKLE